MNTSSCRVVATSFLYLMVHRWIAGDVPITKDLRSEWPTPSENVDFDRFCLIVAQPWGLAREVRLLLIGSRKCAFNRAIDEPCALLLSPKMVGRNENFYIWHCIYFFVAGNCRHFKFGMWVEHSKSQPAPTDDKLSRKGHGHCHVTSLVFSK